MKLYKVFSVFLILFVASFASTNFRLAKAEDDKKLIPVIMYHSILKSGKSDYIVTPMQFENDIRHLLELGYTTVFPSQVIDYVENRKDLPKKPIIITFDDGHYNNLYYAQPILEKYNSRAIINIVGAFSAFSTDSGDHSKPEYSHITWEQIKSAHESGVFEIGNHTYNMHKYKPRFGIEQNKGENTAQYCTNLCNDVSRLQAILKDKCGFEPICFAYPFGKYNKIAQSCLKEMGFKMIFTCTEGINQISRDNPEPLFKMKRFNRFPSQSTEKFFAKIEKLL